MNTTRPVSRIGRLAAAALAVASLAAPSLAQLTPDRVYYGVDRRIPMTVAVPAGAEGEVEILLFEPWDGRGEAPEPAMRVAAVEGGVDLAGLVPSLWESEPTAPPSVRYAQLAVGGEEVGPPVVLQPMLSVDVAVGRPARFQVRPRKVYSGLRAYVDREVVLETTLGDLRVRLRPEEAPNTAYSFAELAEGGFYTDIVFHRVVARLQNGAPFVIQVGDPTGTGGGGPGFNIDLENSRLPHDFGVVSMARSGDPNSNGSQFFICLSREGTAGLDTQYTAFGEVVEGAGTIVQIAATPVGEFDRPIDPPVLESARLVEAPSFSSREPRVERPSDGAAR